MVGRVLDYGVQRKPSRLLRVAGGVMAASLVLSAAVELSPTTAPSNNGPNHQVASSVIKRIDASTVEDDFTLRDGLVGSIIGSADAKTNRCTITTLIGNEPANRVSESDKYILSLVFRSIRYRFDGEGTFTLVPDAATPLSSYILSQHATPATTATTQ